MASHNSGISGTPEEELPHTVSVAPALPLVCSFVCSPPPEHVFSESRLPVDLQNVVIKVRFLTRSRGHCFLFVAVLALHGWKKKNELVEIECDCEQLLLQQQVAGATHPGLPSV